MAKHVDVLHYAKAGQIRKLFHNLGRGPGTTLTEEIENRPPGGVRQRLPDRVELARHQVPMDRAGFDRSFLRLSRWRRHPTVRPARSPGSRNPMARWRSVTLVPPAVSFRRT